MPSFVCAAKHTLAQTTETLQQHCPPLRHPKLG